MHEENFGRFWRYLITKTKKNLLNVTHVFYGFLNAKRVQLINSWFPRKRKVSFYLHYTPTKPPISLFVWNSILIWLRRIKNETRVPFFKFGLRIKGGKPPFYCWVIWSKKTWRDLGIATKCYIFSDIYFEGTSEYHSLHIGILDWITWIQSTFSQLKH